MERFGDVHERLTVQFAASAENRAGALYFADHGLSRDETRAIHPLLRDGLRCKPLSSFDWQTAYLPLLVFAVEIGYEYEGNGTDFWPKMASELGYDFTPEDRERISRWFERASSRYRAVNPGNSQWEQAFRHIAWPITHAVAARDIRRPFADCLRRFHRDVNNDSLKDETIVGDLAQMPTSVGSRRFRTWLGRPAIVAGIVRDLLGGRPLDEAGLFSKLFRDRLIADLRNEPEIRLAVRQVETRRVRKPKSSTGKSDQKKKLDCSYGSFFLFQDQHGGLELCGEMPELPKTVQLALKSIRGRWKVRPWGFPGATPLPADCLRSSRGHFQVSFSYVARAELNAPFFTEIDEQAIDLESKQWLGTVRFPTATMLAFAPMEPGDDSSHCFTRPAVSHGKIWVLSRRDDIQVRRSNHESYCRKVGEVEGGEIHEFEADDPEVRNWLGWPESTSVAKDEVKGFTWIRPSPVSIDSADYSFFTTDDELGISVLVDEPLTLVLRQGSREIARELVLAVATLAIETKGSYSLAVLRGEQEVESFSFGILDDKGDGFIEPDPETPWRAVVAHVDAGETELTRSDLFNRRLNLDVIGDRGIENLWAKISLSPGEANVNIHLDRIPTRLASTHPIWDQLIKSLPASVMKSPCDLSLSVEIEGLSHNTWRLEAALEELWWKEDENGLPIAVNDNGSLAVRHYCVIENKLLDRQIEGDPFLSVALDSDGNELHFDARIDVKGYSTLGRMLRPPARFLRQMDDLDDDPGLRSIAQRYLQVSSASSSSLMAEINRVGAAITLKSWVLRCLCGVNWFHKHQEIRHLETADPAGVWWESQFACEDLLQPPTEKKRLLPNILPTLVLAEFSEILPERWWDGLVADVDADDAIPFDTIFQHLLDDNSIIVDAESLARSLTQASEILCGSALADLIIPVTGGDELLLWQVSDMSVSELASELHLWIRRHLGRGRGRQSWTPEELTIYLNLQLFPERLRKESWESVLEKLIHDRCVARAGAFIAWRMQQNARLGSAKAKAETTYP